MFVKAVPAVYVKDTSPLNHAEFNIIEHAILSEIRAGIFAALHNLC